MLLEGRSRNINACPLIFVSARQHVLISDNSPVREKFFNSNIIQNESARLLRCLQMDYFEADAARSQMFTSDVIKARNVHVAR